MNNEELHQMLSDAEESIANALTDIEHALRQLNLNATDRRKAFSPGGLGAISRMVCAGNGYEPAYFNDAFTIADMCDLVDKYQPKENEDEENEE